MAANVSQATVSRIERGHLDLVNIQTLRAVAGVYDASFVGELRWRGGALDRLLDERHAALSAVVVAALRRDGWIVKVEVTYSVYGERGSIDILAGHRETRSVVVIEIKSEITSSEETHRRLDTKVRLAPGLAPEQFGWRPATVSRILVVLASTANRDRVRRLSELLDVSFPGRGKRITAWLGAPKGRLDGLWFVPLTTTTRGSPARTGPDRVRVARGSTAG